MPTAEKNAYDKLKRNELKALLNQRDQSIKSLQSTLTARVITSQNAHTVIQDDVLNFLGFPGEVRNEIYRLVADYPIDRYDSRACTSLYCEYDWNWKKAKRLIEYGDPQLMILQPGLFLTCRQTRTEGLHFFYQRRNFYLPLNHGKHILNLRLYQAGFSLWFQEIGELGQQNIRRLTLRNAPMMRSISSIERLHRKLSDKAIVVYEAKTCLFATALWNIGAKYQAKSKEKVPVFLNPHSRYNGKISDYEGQPGSYLYEGCRLEFKAGSGWFGMAHDDKAQLWWRKDKRIEKRNQTWLAMDEKSRPEWYDEEPMIWQRWWGQVEERTSREWRSPMEGPSCDRLCFRARRRYDVDSDSEMDEE
jgi:hypothetical protein